MELLAVFESNFVPTALTEASKFPSLTRGNATLMLQANNNFYTASLKYNSVTKWFSLSVIGPNNRIIQGETFVADFPTNLLTCSELKEFGLFYFPKSNDFRFYRLSEGWYNSPELDFNTAYKAILLQVFPDEIVGE